MHLETAIDPECAQVLPQQPGMFLCRFHKIYLTRASAERFDADRARPGVEIEPDAVL